MNDQTIYWLWLQQALGYGSGKLPLIAERFTFAEEFYRAPKSEKRLSGSFSAGEWKRLTDTSLEKAEAVAQQCGELGIRIVTYSDTDYPEQLRNIFAPPAVLYIRGSVSALSEKLPIAMVGTRSATIKGSENAFRLSKELAGHGVCIVSGGAMGIDSQAHKGALQANGKTVCVLGCGHEARYLRSLDYLKKSMIVKGAVISEYPPDFPPGRYTFPQRNRIISGLSKGVVVVEAGQKSGSLITVNYALEQGRDVFAVPGDISSPYAIGTNELIKDGAVPVTSARDIISYYCGVGGTSDVSEPKKTAHDRKQNNSGAKNSAAESKEYILDDPQLLLFNFDKYITDDDPFGVLKNSESDDEPVYNEYKREYKKEKRGEKSKKSADMKKEPAVNSDKNDMSEQTISQKPGEELLDGLSESAVKFYEALKNGELHIDTIAERTGMPINKVHAAATELEMSDLIESLPGRRYKIIS